MSYLFLTGATGLLGAYLIRDLIGHGTKLAVLVRPTRFASARQRVEDTMARWEKLAGHALPRPVVLAGDISQPDLGLDSATLDWVSRHCDSLMHNAASLTFHAESPDGEPWRSNVRGTQNVVDFCRRTGIGDFHHISTAYVCGLRTGCILEDELDVGQELGNDYEISKVQAEKMVRTSDHLQTKTCYRPAIIIGDSQTGYSTTFHGFYVPLKLLSALFSKIGTLGLSRDELAAINRMSSERLRQLMNLNGQERKNYVPVDWVSAVVAHIYAHPEHRDKTYHLTAQTAVPVTTMQVVFEEAFTNATIATSDATDTNVDWAEFEQFFVDQMSVYRSYWRDDPEFDCSNTLAATSCLPQPEVDAAMLSKMCAYAIESNFGWPRPPSAKPEFDIHEHLRPLTEQCLSVTASADAAVSVRLQVGGPGGGQWKLILQEGEVVAIEEGIDSRSTSSLYLNTNTFAGLVRGCSTVEEAVAMGKVLVEGNGQPLGRLAGALEQILPVHTEKQGCVQVGAVQEK